MSRRLGPMSPIEEQSGESRSPTPTCLSDGADNVRDVIDVKRNDTHENRNDVRRNQAGDHGNSFRDRLMSLVEEYRDEMLKLSRELRQAREVNAKLKQKSDYYRSEYYTYMLLREVDHREIKKLNARRQILEEEVSKRPAFEEQKNRSTSGEQEKNQATLEEQVRNRLALEEQRTRSTLEEKEQNRLSLEEQEKNKVVQEEQEKNRVTVEEQAKNKSTLGEQEKKQPTLEEQVRNLRALGEQRTRSTLEEQERNRLAVEEQKRKRLNVREKVHLLEETNRKMREAIEKKGASKERISKLANVESDNGGKTNLGGEVKAEVLHRVSAPLSRAHRSLHVGQSRDSPKPSKLPVPKLKPVRGASSLGKLPDNKVPRRWQKSGGSDDSKNH